MTFFQVFMLTLPHILTFVFLFSVVVLGAVTRPEDLQ